MGCTPDQVDLAVAPELGIRPRGRATSRPLPIGGQVPLGPTF